MFQFFASIAGFISSIVGFVVGSFVALIHLFMVMVQSVTWLFACVAALPPFLTAFLLVPISLAVIFQVLNKGG